MNEMKKSMLHIEISGERVDVGINVADVPDFLANIELLLRGFSEQTGVPLQKLVRLLVIGTAISTAKLEKDQKEAADHGGESNQDAVR